MVIRGIVKPGIALGIYDWLHKGGYLYMATVYSDDIVGACTVVRESVAGESMCNG